MSRKILGALGALMLVFTAVSAQATKPTKGNYVADATTIQLDPKLPEPFARAKAVQIYTNFDYQDVTLFFYISDSEGIEITFPIVKDSVDSCSNREIIAAPPEGSTPYYKDFEIKVIDYSENSCDNIKVAAPTFASLRSYEVRHKATTQSSFLAGFFKEAPQEEQ
jgi:hypothetical protein